jgi:hypothetical protein
MCCAAAKMKGEAMGIKDSAQLVAFASDGGAKTQSMYDTMHRPQALSPTVSFLIPFQIFSFEALTRIREMADIHIPEKIAGVKVPFVGGALGNVRAGSYRTVAANSAEGQAVVAKRMVRFAEFAVAIMVANMLGDYFNKRKPWEYTSFLPFYNTFVYGVSPTGRNEPVFARYYNELMNGYHSYVQSGEIDDFVQWAVKWHTAGGFQTSKAYRGILAVIEGEYEVSEDVWKAGDLDEGQTIEVENGDLLNAIIYGVWGTEQGQEWLAHYIDKLPITTKEILRDLTAKEAQLGQSVDGKWYTLKSYYSNAMSTFKTNNIPSWMVSDDIPIYSPLTVFASQCDDAWEEYKSIFRSEDKLQYRKDYPFIEATLFFWEQVSTLHSQEAEDYVRQLDELYGVTQNPQMRMSGFADIPDEYKLISE